MNLSKQYSKLGLVNLVGIPAMCLLASPALAQSGFVPIGKPQAPIIGGSPQHTFSPAIEMPSGSIGVNVELGSSESLKPMGASTTGRAGFGGQNYGAPRNGGTQPDSSIGTLPPPMQSKAATPQSFGSQTKPRAIESVSTGQQFSGSSQDDSYSSSKAQIDVDTCSVHLIDDIDIPARESGQLKELNVKEGDAVPANKVIGMIDQTLLQIELERVEMELEVSREMASDTSGVDVAKKKASLAKHEYEVASRLASKGSRSNQERMRAKYSKDASYAEVSAAKMQQREALGQARIKEVNVKQIRQMINNSQVETKFSGQVLDIYKHPGEWVNKGEPIVHFARIERVWVQGTVSADECNIQDVMGQKTIITLIQAGGDKVTFNGTIVSIPLKMEAAGSRFRVKAEVQNRFENGAWLLRPDAQLSMKIDLSPNTAKRNADRFNR